jgi:hypothetical protein
MIPMDIPHTNIVYQFEQRVEIMYRESERTQPTNEVYQRHGIILVSAGVNSARWKREITEYEISESELTKVRQQDKVDRAELQEGHLKKLEARRIPFGLELPVEVESDMLNRDVTLAGSERVPLRQDLLYLPTLLPVVPAKRAEPGHEWAGKIEVLGGAGRFQIPYTAKMLPRQDENPSVDLKFQPHASSQAIKGITLTLSPQGHLVTAIAKRDGSPLTCEGDITISIRAKLSRDGTPVDVEVLKCHQQFKLSRVAAAFNDDFLLTAGWKLSEEKGVHPP